MVSNFGMSHTIPLGLALINKGQDKIRQKAASNSNNKGTQVKVDQVSGKGTHLQSTHKPQLVEYFCGRIIYLRKSST